MNFCKTDQDNHIRLEDHMKGTTWDGLTLVYSSKDENNQKVPFNLTGCEVIFEFKKTISGSSVFELSTKSGSVVFGSKDVPDPTTGRIVALPRLITQHSFDYYFVCKLVKPDGTVDPILTGYWQIID